MKQYWSLSVFDHFLGHNFALSFSLDQSFDAWHVRYSRHFDLWKWPLTEMTAYHIRKQNGCRDFCIFFWISPNAKILIQKQRKDTGFWWKTEVCQFLWSIIMQTSELVDESQQYKYSQLLEQLICIERVNCTCTYTVPLNVTLH